MSEEFNKVRPQQSGHKCGKEKRDEAAAGETAQRSGHQGQRAVVAHFVLQASRNQRDTLRQ